MEGEIIDENIIIVKTSDLKTIEKLALNVGQESTIGSFNRFTVGWLAKCNNKNSGGIGLFEFEDGFVIDYVSPAFTNSNYSIIETLARALINEANEMDYFPLTVVRDKKDTSFFVDRLDFEETDIDNLPYVYKKRTIELCNKCDKYLKECIPVVFRYGKKV